jgi:hypothetical protein
MPYLNLVDGIGVTVSNGISLNSLQIPNATNTAFSGCNK